MGNSKLFIFLFIMTFCFSSLVIAESNNSEKTICSYSYYFIINHLQAGNVLDYGISDLDSLKSSLIVERGIDVGNVSALKPYIENYTLSCLSETPDLKLPPIIIDIKTIEIILDDEFLCDAEIDKTFLGFYDMDWSIPFPQIHRGIINCDNTQFFKWFLKYEKTGKYDYSVSGIKLWGIFLFLIISLIVVYYKINRKINDVIEKESARG